MNSERHMFGTSWVESHNDKAMEDELYEIQRLVLRVTGW